MQDEQYIQTLIQDLNMTTTDFHFAMSISGILVGFVFLLGVVLVATKIDYKG